MKISPKSALIASAVMLFVFMLALLAFFLTHQKEGIHSQKQVSEAVLITGRDEPDTPYLELLPGQTIDLNSADRDTLEKLPGIGSKKSQRIIDYREQTGSFNSIEDIMLVDGINENDFAEIKDMIGIGAENENTGS